MNKGDITYCSVYIVNDTSVVAAKDVKDAIDIYYTKYNITVTKIETIRDGVALINPKSFIKE